MKQKKEKCGQVSVCSSLASESGPHPVIKVKKHFKAVREVNNSTSRRDDISTEPNLVSKLPNFIIDDLEEQQEGEYSQVQQQALKSEPQDCKRKW
jgi:hypothetical protein